MAAQGHRSHDLQQFGTTVVWHEAKLGNAFVVALLDHGRQLTGLPFQQEEFGLESVMQLSQTQHLSRGNWGKQKGEAGWSDLSL